jgi:predicted NBD/HSP70 family sugar kinase
VAEGELAGDEACGMLMERARQAFAVACVGWVNAFDPALIVVGGTRGRAPGRAMAGSRAGRRRGHGSSAPAARVRIVPAQLGDDVGLVGAWPLVEQRCGDPTWREKRHGPVPANDSGLGAGGDSGRESGSGSLEVGAAPA